MSPMDFLNYVGVIDPIITAERTVIGYVLNWVRLIGTGVALIMITYIAIRFMMARGPAEQAAIRKSFGNYLIGAIVLIGATNIIYFVEQFVEEILTDVIS